MRKINEIIIHCTATPASRDITVEQIRALHVNCNRWADIGYHYVIYRNGEIHPGRPTEQPGAHCKGHNANSIGIAYVGGLLDDARTPADTRTPEQKAALIALISRLQKSYPGATVHSHRDFARKACPCFNATKEYSTLMAAIIIMLTSALATSCRSQKQTVINDTDIKAIEKILTLKSRYDTSELSIDITFDSVLFTAPEPNKNISAVKARKATIGINRKSATATATISAVSDSTTVADRQETTSTTGKKHHFPVAAAILTGIAIIATLLRINSGLKS